LYAVIDQRYKLQKREEIIIVLKISKNTSLNLSIVISVVFMALCIAGLFIMPSLTKLLIETEDNIGDRNAITQGGRTFVLVLSYLLLAVFMLADALLFMILKRVKSGKVFTAETVSLIRGVSYCCFLVGLLFALLGIYFQLAFIVAFMAVFLGICLRVVKNVIEEATEIKAENELTV
jgi:hypothetical protein